MIDKMLKKLEELNIESQSCSECAYIKECDAMQEKYDIPDNVCLCTMLMKLKAKEIVQEVAAEYNNGWVPCSERLPNKEEYQKCNGQFIVSDGNRTYATYFDIYDTMKFGEPTIERFRIDKRVIAWQPLPAPYQNGE